jgi:alkylhydroperoxidase family enzyme
VLLTESPVKVSAQSIAALRTNGLSDTAVVEAAEVIAFFNYINRIAEGLGVDLEPEMPVRSA